MWRGLAPEQSFRRIAPLVEAGTFDGNLTYEVESIFYDNGGFRGINTRAMRVLVRMLRDGSLDWIVVPPAGYRV